MKLYTEEQVRDALWKTEHPFSDGKNVDEIMKSLTPIELPSDEEIGKESHNYFMRGQLGFEAAADTERAFLRGVLWMKEQILNQNK
jgi:hypothetical protein